MTMRGFKENQKYNVYLEISARFLLDNVVYVMSHVIKTEKPDRSKTNQREVNKKRNQEYSPSSPLKRRKKLELRDNIYQRTNN